MEVYNNKTGKIRLEQEAKEIQKEIEKKRDKKGSKKVRWKLGEVSKEER